MLERSSATIRTEEIDNAAHVAVSSALGLSFADHLVVLGDGRSTRIGVALAQAGQKLGAKVSVVDLDAFGPRPLKALPDEVVELLGRAQASCFVGALRHAELGLRQHLLHLVQRFSLRHAHMPGISQLAFARGMRLDYQRVRLHGARLLEKLEHARRLEAQSGAGTRLQIELDPERRWFSQLGVLEPGRWGNLPAGALYASPARIEGLFVANAALGEYFGEREGCLLERPVRFVIEDSRVVNVEVPSSSLLAAEIVRMLAFSPSSDRVGIVALGVNVGIDTPTGEALVDQNLPGLHLAIGDPAARVTGASYSAPTSFAACQADSSVLIDGVIAIHRGKLLSPT